MDVFALVAATLLHDCALHLSEDGFVSLLRTKTVGEFDWRRQWSEFLVEAKRFDAKQLVRLFGRPQPIRVPPLSPSRMTLADRMLIGEFLRRHHHVLAHDFAMNGIPGPNGRVLQIDGVPSDLIGLIGVIARSHGDHLRAHFGTLVDRFDIREYRKTHPVFLMTLIRISDYLQIESERAPASLLQVRALRSPVSRGEWNAHSAIRDIRTTHLDPEAIFVDARPDDAVTFLRVQSWATDIQRELDESWAVLGEVYGRFEELRPLELRLRRVRTSLEDVARFSQTVDYVPVKACFDAATPDLLQLLVAPLYSDEPAIGIRELMQNAVDAVKERQALGAADHSHVADVTVVLSAGKGAHSRLTIVDRGVGMNAEIVTKFFLMAGASYRRSDAWKRQFLDAKGRSRVQRSGRFGIGVLAAFLLGPTLTVRTRRLGDVDGLEFSCSIDSANIELKRVAREDAGTEIEIQLGEGMFDRLYSAFPGYPPTPPQFDWYVLDDIYVARIAVLGEKQERRQALQQRRHLPLPGDSRRPDWHEFQPKGFESVFWTYSKECPALACNGIVVTEEDDYRHWRWRVDSSLREPKLHVFDPDGNLPLNLQRSELASSPSFSDELHLDVCQDVVALALARAPEGAISEPESAAWYFAANHPALLARRWIGRDYLRWMSTEAGIAPLSPYLLGRCGIETLRLTGRHTKKSQFALRPVPNGVASSIIVGNSPTSIGWTIRSLFSNDYSHDLLTHLAVRGTRLLMPSKIADAVLPNSKLFPGYMQRLVSIRDAGRGFTVLQSGAPQRSGLGALINQAEASKKFGPGLVAEIDIEPDQHPKVDLFGLEWERILGRTCIPFSKSARRRQLGHVFRRLESKILRWKDT